jgi:hypothetical protein
MILPCTYKRNLKYDTTQDVKKLLMALMDKMEKNTKTKTINHTIKTAPKWF